MKSPRVDRTRLDALRAVTARRKAALDSANDRMAADQDLSTRLRREAAKLRDRGAPRGSMAAVNAEIEAKERQRAEADARIAEGAQAIEILREEARAASRLQSRCEAFARGAGAAE